MTSPIGARLPVNLRSIDLNLLLAFAAIYKHGNVTVAGQEIGLSQSAMSGALQRLRRVFQDPLFVRLSHGVAPTSRAEELEPVIRDVLLQLHHAVSLGARFDAATSGRTFRIFMNDLGEAALLPQMLGEVRRRAPHVSLVVPELRLEELPQALAHGQIDLAVGVLPNLETGFRHEPLLEETYVCIVRDTHPVLRRKLTREAFAKLRHASFTSMNNAHRAIVETLERAGIRRHVAAEVPHFVVIPILIANSDLVVILPRTIAEWFSRFLDLRVLDLPFPLPSFEVRSHWHERRETDAGLRWLRGLVRDAVAALRRRGAKPDIGRGDRLDREMR